MRKAQKLDILLPQVLPQAVGCPVSVALDALKLAAVDFCREGKVWTAVLQDAASAGDSFIAFLSLPAGAVISSVRWLELDGEKIEKSRYEAARDGVLLKFIPERDLLATIEAALRPKRTAGELPEEIIEEWGQAFAYGALAKLKAMSGPKLEWTDAQGATLNFQLYQEELCRAKEHSLRRKLGSGPLYMNGADE